MASQVPTPTAVIIPIEFTQGQHVTVIISETIGNKRTLQGVPFVYHFQDTPSVQWTRLRQESKWWNHDSNELTLPKDQFRYDKRVEDTVVGVCMAGKNVIPATQHVSARKKPVLVILESPHKHEYTDDVSFTPTGPLLKQGCRGRVLKQLYRLLLQAKVKWRDMVGAEVIIVNPVPFQASLYRLLATQHQDKMPRQLCNQVWHALYTAQNANGEAFVQLDFVGRVATFDPRIIINACTTDLRKDVQDTLENLNYQPIRVSDHPSGWDKDTYVVK